MKQSVEANADKLTSVIFVHNIFINQIYSGSTCGRVLNGELYT